MSKTSKSQDKNKISMRSFLSPAYNKLDKANVTGGGKRKVSGSVVKKTKINSESEIFRTQGDKSKKEPTSTKGAFYRTFNENIRSKTKNSLHSSSFGPKRGPIGAIKKKSEKLPTKRSGAKTAKGGAKKGSYRLLKEKEMLSKLDQSKSLRKLKRKKTLGDNKDTSSKVKDSKRRGGLSTRDRPAPP